jgi:integrase
MTTPDRWTSDPIAALEDESPQTALTTDEAHYVSAAQASNTLRGYRSDWREFTTWCGEHGQSPLPAQSPTVSGYLTELAGYGAKVGIMSRRLSAIKFAHALRNLPDPTAHARVIAVWEGIRRTHGAPPEQAAPLMPPELNTVLAACPTIRHWKTPGRSPESDCAGARDRALLLVGFVAALRRSELAALDVEHLTEHPNGMVAAIARSKINQRGEQAELVVLPRGGDPDLCPVTALQAWLDLAAGGAPQPPVRVVLCLGRKRASSRNPVRRDHEPAHRSRMRPASAAGWSKPVGPG